MYLPPYKESRWRIRNERYTTELLSAIAAQRGINTRWSAGNAKTRI